MDIRIRRATVRDIPIVEGILLDAVEWLERIGNPLWTRTQATWDWLSQSFEIGDFCIATIDDEPIGCMALADSDRVVWPQIPKGQSLFIHKLAVKRCAAGQGVSAALIDYAKRACIQRGIHILRLDTQYSNDKLRGLYERHGFVFAGRTLLYDKYDVALYAYHAHPIQQHTAGGIMQNSKISKIGIVGYGNLGKAAAALAMQSPHIELCGIFTRRQPDGIVAPVPVMHVDALTEYKGKLDALVLCGGSATDLPEQSPLYARDFTIIDSFDTHARIPEHYAAVDAAAKSGGNTAIISVGWDPGLFSLMRALGDSIIPNAAHYTFWGKGVSQGHGDAIRRVDGVVDAVQYTIPVPAAVEAVRSGSNPDLTTRQKHTRACYVVAADGADKAAIERTIVTMPNYFADYDTTVHFVTAEELKAHHSGLPHGGFTMSGGTLVDSRAQIEFALTLGSNPEFTAAVLLAYTNAAVRMNQAGMAGAYTIYDVAPKFLSHKSYDELLTML